MTTPSCSPPNDCQDSAATPDVFVMTIAGAGYAGCIDIHDSLLAKFDTPTSVALSPSARTLYVADRNNGRIRRVEFMRGGLRPNWQKFSADSGGWTSINDFDERLGVDTFLGGPPTNFSASPEGSTSRTELFNKWYKTLQGDWTLSTSNSSLAIDGSDGESSSDGSLQQVV